MEIKKPAVAGTLESSDCQIVIRPNGGEGIEIELESDVAVMFGDSIRETIKNTLEEFGVYISAGSACSSHKRKPSATLTAMGLSRADVESTVRISFCEENTFEEVDYCLEALGKTIPMLRRYARR